jgi:uncharacterized membrane protein (DUF4010 family)
MDLDSAANIAVATLTGLAVGVEREWSGHTRGPDARFAGVRTFALLGGLGGVAGLLLTAGFLWAATALLAGGAALSVAAYVMAVKREGSTTDGTTETAAIAVLAVGTMAGLGWLALASGLTALMAFALIEKSRVQEWLKKVDEHEMRAALQFAVLALVVLPLLPSGSFGPYDAIRPRELWIVVLLFSGLNFAGYVARQVVGNERGYGVTGLLGGLVSSTAVTLHFSRKSKDEPEYAEPLGLGVVAACTVLVPRVIIVSSLLEPNVGGAVLPFLALPFLVGAGIVTFVLLRESRATKSGQARDNASRDSASRDNSSRNDASQTNEPPTKVSNGVRNPLGLWQSVQMALAFQVVLLIIAWLQESVGTPGVLVTAFALGLTDMDALTLSMSRLGADETRRLLAATAIAVGLLANTLLKLTLTLALGSRAFQKRASTGLIALALASGAGLMLGTWLAAR